MTRNSESHFANIPSVDIQRSVFDLSSGHITTCNAGDIIPVFCKEVLAGDTFDVSTSVVCRAQTMLTPIFSNINLDYYYYFIPFRLIWTHFPEFFGENTSSAWVQTTEYQIPSISAPSGGFATNSLADYFGYPIGVQWSATDKLAPSALPFRAYALCVDQWHRDQNVTDPLNIPTGDSNQTGTNGSSYINDVANGGMPFKAAKYHDYFTSCLPTAQKGPAVTFGTGAAVTVDGLAPVGSLNVAHDFSEFPMVSSQTKGTTTYNNFPLFYGQHIDSTAHIYGQENALWNPDADTSVITGKTDKEPYVTPVNLWADLENTLACFS